MDICSLNKILRSVVQELINDGFHKKPICDGTLGSQSNPQFDGFIKGVDLGIKPLTRLLDSLGYEIYVIPVKKEDKLAEEWSEKQLTGFSDDVKAQLIQYLENRPASERNRSIKGTLTGDLQSGVEEILNKLKDM